MTQPAQPIQPVQPSPPSPELLVALRRAVAEALEKKRRLGQYAVVWENGKAMRVGDDAGNVPPSIVVPSPR